MVLRAGFLLLAGFAVLISGCSFVSLTDYRSAQHQGLAISERQLAMASDGGATREWLLDHIGDPDTSETLGDDVELLGYIFAVSKDARTRVFPFYNKRTVTQESEVIYFRLEDGVVTKSWHLTSVVSPPQEAYTPRRPPKVLRSASSQSQQNQASGNVNVSGINDPAQDPVPVVEARGVLPRKTLAQSASSNSMPSDTAAADVMVEGMLAESVSLGGKGSEEAEVASDEPPVIPADKKATAAASVVVKTSEGNTPE